jgi:hypothetical protein
MGGHRVARDSTQYAVSPILLDALRLKDFFLSREPVRGPMEAAHLGVASFS